MIVFSSFLLCLFLSCVPNNTSIFKTMSVPFILLLRLTPQRMTGCCRLMENVSPVRERRAGRRPWTWRRHIGPSAVRSSLSVVLVRRSYNRQFYLCTCLLHKCVSNAFHNIWISFIFLEIYFLSFSEVEKIPVCCWNSVWNTFSNTCRTNASLHKRRVPVCV